MEEVRNHKAELRSKILQELYNITPESREYFSAKITEKIFELPEYKEANTIMVYFSLPEEFDTTELIESALSSGKEVCAPRIDWKHRDLIPVKIESVTDYKIGRYNLKEPAGNDLVQINKINLLLLPGLVFDLKGYRLGRGAGFYDKFLARPETRCIVKLAPIFDTQLVFSIPKQDHDIKADIIVTPKRILRFRHKRYNRQISTLKAD